MNFLSAIKHAVIGYGIRRKVWQKDAILYLGSGGQDALYWIYIPGAMRNERGGRGDSVKLCGPDKSYDLQPEDITADDWEAI